MVGSVALLVARRTNDRQVAGSRRWRPTKVVCITVLTGNRMGWTARCGRPPLLLPSCRKLEFRLSALMDSDLAWVNGKSGRQSWRYADAFQRSIISEAIYHFLTIFWCVLFPLSRSFRVGLLVVRLYGFVCLFLTAVLEKIMIENNIEYRMISNFRVTRKPAVVAGLRWPPLTCPIVQTNVAMPRPNVSEIRTMSLPGHEPHPTSISSNVPRNSTNNAFQNFAVFNWSMSRHGIVFDLRTTSNTSSTSSTTC